MALRRLLKKAAYCTFTAPCCKLLVINGAGEGNRTLVSGLGSPRSTIEPHPRSDCSKFTVQVVNFKAHLPALLSPPSRIPVRNSAPQSLHKQTSLSSTQLASPADGVTD